MCRRWSARLKLGCRLKTARSNQRLKQPTPKELTDDLLGLIQRKWYAGDEVSFRKDRSRLLIWVVLWPASWLNGRGVTLPLDRYREIFVKIVMEAVVHGTEKVTYRPAWLRQVNQSHFGMHGDEYYEEAKSARSLVETALMVAGRPAVASPDPIRELATVRSLLASPKRAAKPPKKEQLSLL